MGRHGIQTAGIVAPRRPDRLGCGGSENHFGRICHRTSRGPLLATDRRSRRNRRDNRNFTSALVWLLLVWTWAAFGEEVGYRGYLLTRAADLGGRTTAAYWIGIVLVAVLFGYGHYYKGPTGILDSAVAGLILGAVYMLSGRNLWASILAHGFIDTFGVVAAFFGWDA
jgi:membrane protease YdiL (CAAX protease family)